MVPGQGGPGSPQVWRWELLAEFARWRQSGHSVMTLVLPVFLAALRLGVAFSFFLPSSFLYVYILSKVAFENATTFLWGSSFSSFSPRPARSHVTWLSPSQQTVELQVFNPLQTTRASALTGWALMQLFLFMEEKNSFELFVVKRRQALSKISEKLLNGHFY